MKSVINVSLLTVPHQSGLQQLHRFSVFRFSLSVKEPVMLLIIVIISLIYAPPPVFIPVHYIFLLLLQKCCAVDIQFVA